MLFWTDSTIVLSYIQSESIRFHRFVFNKVSYIRNFSDPAHWNYINTKENPADMISRGCTAKALIDSQLWKNGPASLIGEYSSSSTVFTVDENDVEIKSTSTQLSSKIVEESPTDKVMNSCSSWYKLKVRVAVLMKFRESLRQKVGVNHDISIANLHQAEITIVKYLQNKYFSTELYKCSKNENLQGNSQLRKLAPFIDEEGILRVGGRLCKSNLTFTTRHPIILPDSNIAMLILNDVHVSMGHLGRETVISSVRKKYHILSANKLTRKLLRDCVICRKYNGRTLTQYMADLPAQRLEADIAPFTNTGVDLFGPFMVTQGRKLHKRYGVLFTCLSCRAVHLEVASSLTTDSYINALRRFLCRRGNVKSFVSDNGTNLVGSCNELKRSIGEWNAAHIENECYFFPSSRVLSFESSRVDQLKQLDQLN